MEIIEGKTNYATEHIRIFMLAEKILVNVFISYSRNDGADLSSHLNKHLKDKDYDVFLDTVSLSVGAKWKPRIESAIDRCDVFVLIITLDSINSNEVKEEYTYATSKRKVSMLFKHRSVKFDDLPWDLKAKNILEFDTKEQLVRIFDEKFTEVDNLLTHDLNDPFVVQKKLSELKKEFDVVPEDNHDKIKSYTDDVFIPIVTFLNKSPILYEKEKIGIIAILERVTKLSLNIEEKKEVSEEAFVKIDADLLRSNLSKFLDYLLNLFVNNTPEMRRQRLSQSTSHEELEEMVHVEPITKESKDFLDISLDRNLSENLKYEYFKQDVENQRIDLRFFYLAPESVDLWFKIVNLSDYKLNEYGRENIKNNASDLITIILEKSGKDTDHIDLVDLGVGSAVKDYYLLKHLLERMSRDSNRMNYVPLDYSIAILSRVMDYMDNLMDTYPNKLHIEGILGDFFRLFTYRDRINELSKSPKVFALLGNILGNVDEFSILDAISKTMNPNDHFLLEIDLIDDRTDDLLKAGYGSDDITKKFLLTPILKHLPANKRTGAKIEDFELHTDIQTTSIIPNSKTVSTSAYYGRENSEKINLIKSHKYDLQSVVNYLYSNLKLGHIKTYKEKSSCILLLQKLPI